MSSVPFDDRIDSPLVSRRVLRTVAVATGLSGMCAAYSVATRPLLEAPPAPTLRHSVAVAPAMEQPHVRLAAEFLPDAPWTKQPGYTFRNTRSIMYTNAWEPVEEQRAVKFTPFALVLQPPDNDPNRTPITIVGETAILRFEGSVDLTGGKPGRIIGGAVQGAVTLRGADGLELIGQNFNFDEAAMRLWSDEDVTFKQGGNSGSGHGLQVEFFRIGILDRFDTLALSGIKSVQLRRDVTLDVQTDGQTDGLFGAAPAPAGAGTQAAEPVPLHVTSRGPLSFDLRGNIATFTEQVRVERRLPDAAGVKPDALDCGVLRLVLEPGTPEALAKSQAMRTKAQTGTLDPDDGFQTIDEQLVLKKLIAEGTLATITSPSNDFAAQATTIVHDATTGVTTLLQPGGTVNVRQASTYLSSPQIHLHPDAAGGPPTVICNGGPGWIRHLDEAQQPALLAQWQQKLTRSRNADGKDVIQLLGAANVQQPQDNFTLTGDLVELWLDPQSERQSRPVAASPTSAVMPAFASGKLEPTRLLARTNVKLASPELRADAKELDVTFVAADAVVPVLPLPPAQTSPVPQTSRVDRSTLQLVAGNTPTNAVNPASAKPLTVDETVTPVVPLPATKTAPPEPLQLIAEKIAVVVERGRDGGPASPSASDSRRGLSGDGGKVREVHTAGNVRVRQQRPEGEPLLIRGEKLDLYNRGEGQELVEIHGTPAAGEAASVPAEVHDQGSSLYGQVVRLDRRENKAWVDGEGLLRLPVKNTPDGKPLDTPRRLDVWWTERMLFDGIAAVFYGDVRTVLEADRMYCHEMEVRLKERFNFASAGGRLGSPTSSSTTEESTRADIAEVICRHGVEVRGHEYEGEKLISVRQAEFWQFRLDRATGDTFAEGPGWIEMHRRGQANRAGLASNHQVQANAPVQHTKDRWEYLRVDFGGTSVGNIDRRSNTFQDDVQVIYGPVADPNRKLVPDRLPPEGGWMTCQALTITQRTPEGAGEFATVREAAGDAAAEPQAPKAYIELLAEGNVRLEGRSFYASADTVAYDESKGSYLLKSFGNRAATIYREVKAGAGKSKAEARAMEFYPAKNLLKADQTTGFDGVR